MIEKFTVGADPEGFLFDEELNKFIPAIGMVGGSKEQPRMVDRGYSVLEDNVMIEYNIPPADMGEGLRQNIEYANMLIREDILPQSVKVVYQPSVVFSKEDLTAEKALEFGCEPDFDIYTQEKRCSEQMIHRMIEKSIRFAGGHVHFGYEDPDMGTSAEMIPLFDLFLGVPSVILDEDQARRDVYGQPGMFRFKEYGFEYRTLSNFWIGRHEDLIVSQIRQAIETINNGVNIDNDIPDIINTIKYGNKNIAKKLIQKYQINV